MKKTLAWLFFFILIIGCKTIPFIIKEYEIGKTTEVTVGSAMMAWGKGLSTSSGTPFDGLRKELSYSGIAQNVLQINYREFYIVGEGEYAREAFYQDLKYDITASKIITFKDIKIEVDSADQQKIKFTVIKGPDEIEYTTTGNGKTKEIKIGTGKIGITIDADCTIKEIYTNGPAEAAGLMEGDVILQIDGLPAPCKDGQRLLSKITGQPGTEVLLLVSRDGKELSFRVKRKKM